MIENMEDCYASCTWIENDGWVGLFLEVEGFGFRAFFGSIFGTVGKKFSQVGQKVVETINHPDFQGGVSMVVLLKSVEICPAFAQNNPTENKENMLPKTSRTWKQYFREFRNYNLTSTARNFLKNPKSFLTKENGTKLVYTSLGVGAGIGSYYLYKNVRESKKVADIMLIIRAWWMSKQPMDPEVAKLVKNMLRVHKQILRDQEAGNWREKYGGAKKPLNIKRPLQRKHPLATSKDQKIIDAMASQIIKDVFIPEFVKTQEIQKK
jgi:hypothetical protein